MEYLKPFLAGFFSTLIFHQGTLAALHLAGFWPKAAFPMTPTKPFRIPAVISLALWGGVWGIALWQVIEGLPFAQFWAYAFLLGAIFPSIVALLVVFPLKGLPVAGGWDPKVVIPVLILNGSWGLGVGVLMKLAPFFR